MNSNSVLSKLDPRLKIITTMIFITIVFITTSQIVLIVLFVMLLLLIVLAELSYIYIIKKMKHPVCMVVVMTLLQILIAPHGQALIQIGSMRITEVAIIQGLLIFTRLMLVIVIVFVLITTTTPQAFILSIESFLQPVKKIGLQPAAFVFTFRIIQRFVPTLYEEALRILKAQASRGLDVKHAHIYVKMKLIAALLLPVFVIAVKRADELSDAMAVRGYVVNGKRTNLRSLKVDYK